jgi:hypothetical protein
MESSKVYRSDFMNGFGPLSAGCHAVMGTHTYELVKS